MNRLVSLVVLLLVAYPVVAAPPPKEKIDITAVRLATALQDQQTRVLSLRIKETLIKQELQGLEVIHLQMRLLELVWISPLPAKEKDKAIEDWATFVRETPKMVPPWYKAEVCPLLNATLKHQAFKGQPTVLQKHLLKAIKPAATHKEAIEELMAETQKVWWEQTAPVEERLKGIQTNLKGGEEKLQELVEQAKRLKK